MKFTLTSVYRTDGHETLSCALRLIPHPDGPTSIFADVVLDHPTPRDYVDALQALAVELENQLDDEDTKEAP